MSSINIPPIPPSPVSNSHEWREWFSNLRQNLLFVNQATDTTFSYSGSSTVIDGGNIVISSSSSLVIIDPVRDLSALNLLLPSSASDGKCLTIVITKKVTTLSVISTATVQNAPTTHQLLATTPESISGVGFKFIYIDAITTWIRVY